MAFITGDHGLIEHEDGYFYAPSSVIKDDVKIGKGTKIWYLNNLYGCEIGENVQVGALCEIRKDVKIGDFTRIQSHVFIPEGITIGQYVFIGPKVCFTNEKWPSAVKSVEACGILEDTHIKDFANIGANSTIISSITIGEFSLVGAGSIVTKDVPDYAVVVGSPAKKVGDIREPRFMKRYPELVKYIKDWGEFEKPQ